MTISNVRRYEERGPPLARVEISWSKPTKQSLSAVLTLLDDSYIINNKSPLTMVVPVGTESKQTAFEVNELN